MAGRDVRGDPRSAQRDVREHRQRFIPAVQRHESLSGLPPVPGRVEVRIDVPRLFQPGERVLRRTRIREDQPHVGPVPGIVGIDLDGPAHVLQCELVRAAVQASVREQRMARAVTIVEFDGALGQGVRLVQGGTRGGRVIAPLPDPHGTQQRVGDRVAGVERNRLLEQARRLGGRLRVVPRQRIAALHAFVGSQARRRLATGAFRIGRLHATDQRADDPLHHFVLDREDLGLRAVEPVTPDLAAALAVDELNADADAVADAAHAAFDDVANVEVVRDSSRFHDAGPVPRRGRARPDGQHSPAGQLGDDVPRHSVTEEFLFRISAEVCKRQHGDRDALRAGGGRPGCGNRPRCRRGVVSRRLQQQAEGAHDLLECGTAARAGVIIEVDGMKSPEIDRQRGLAESHGHEDAAVCSVAGFPADPSGLNGILGPDDEHRGRLRELHGNRPIELLARRDRGIPPDGPAVGLQRRHERRDPVPVAARVGDEDVCHAARSSAARMVDSWRPRLAYPQLDQGTRVPWPDAILQRRSCSRSTSIRCTSNPTTRPEASARRTASLRFTMANRPS